MTQKDVVLTVPELVMIISLSGMSPKKFIYEAEERAKRMETQQRRSLQLAGQPGEDKTVRLARAGYYEKNAEVLRSVARKIEVWYLEEDFRKESI